MTRECDTCGTEKSERDLYHQPLPDEDMFFCSPGCWLGAWERGKFPDYIAEPPEEHGNL